MDKYQFEAILWNARQVALYFSEDMSVVIQLKRQSVRRCVGDHY